MSTPAERLQRALAAAGHGLVEREPLLQAVALGAVAREHVLVIGPPGTAKSEAVRRMARACGGRAFEYLLGRFTEPSEVFGPVDLRKLREGVVETETAGMLPEAEFAFLDEVFRGSTAILNTLLGILNERRFRRGHTSLVCPLRVCVGAANTLPDDESLAAFADRFLLRVFVDPVPDPQIEALLEGGWSTGAAQDDADRLTSDDLDRLAEAARAMDLVRVRPRLADALRTLRAAGIVLSDRRAVRTQLLVAAAAAIAGRAEPTAADLWPIVLAVPTREQQALAREALTDVLAETSNPALAAAAEEASRGPVVRAERLALAARTLLEAPPAEGAARASWRLRLEGVVREIDAGFATDALPAPLRDVRPAVVAALAPTP